MNTTPRVAVIGGGDCTQTEAALAEEVGQLLAESGAILLTGGRGGVMAAAGGLVVGILPGDDANQANPWVMLPIITGMGEARNAILMRTAHAVIAVGGEYGILSEIAFALKFGRPVVGLHTWRVSGPNQTALPIHSVDSAAQSVAAALAALHPDEGAH